MSDCRAAGDRSGFMMSGDRIYVTTGILSGLERAIFRGPTGDAICWPLLIRAGCVRLAERAGMDKICQPTLA